VKSTSRLWVMRLQTSAVLESSRGRVVLKITITDLSDEQRWSLQGQLVGQWAAELKSPFGAKRAT